MTLKSCTKCGELFQIEDFYIANRRTGQRTARCAPCVRETVAEWRSKNPAKVKEVDARYRAKHKESRRAIITRYKARKRGAVRYENIRSIEVFAADGFRCYLCNEVFETTDLQIDHIVPVSRGGTHTRDNVATACGHCNASKGAKLLEEMGIAR